MHRRVFRVASSLAILTILLAAVGCRKGVEIGDLQTKSETVELDDVGSVQVAIDLAAGELIVSGGAAELLEADFAYNVVEMEPEITYSGDNLTVTHPEVRIVGSLSERDDYRNEWDLRFNDGIPMAMIIDVAAGRSDLTLGSLALSSLGMKAGAGDVTVDLTGAPSLAQLDFEMGAGALSMDLTGDWTDDLEADITGGVGEMTLRLPGSVGVRVDVKEGVGNVNASNLTKDGDSYTNDAYGESEVTLRFNITSAVGNINLEAEPAPVAAEPAPTAEAPAGEEEAQEEEVAVFDEEIASQLQAVLEAAVASPDTNYPGAVLHVSSPELGSWTGAAGLGEVETNTAMRSHDKFRAGSLTKPFISVVVLQLVEEGLFSLDDPMTAVLPESITGKFANSDQITVRMLLNHTGGLPDFLDLAGPEIVANLEKVWEEEEFLEFASAQEPWFAPGEAQAYSNTDYTLLGMIIEEATGGSWREEMRQRIFEPLNLENTLLPELNDVTIPGDHAHGYADFGAGLVDATELANPSVVGAAGGQSLVTNAEDLSRFVTAVAAGELFQETGTMEEMLTFVPWPDGNLLSPYVNGYGLGVLQSAFGGGIEGVGHSGNTQGGYNSFVFYLPDQDMTISGAVNTDDFEAGYLLVPRALEVLVPGYSAPESEAEQPTPAGNVYEDPEGRFRVPLIGDWTQLETDGTYATFALADPPLELHFITADTDDLQVGVDTVIQGIGTDPTALTPTLAGETLGSWNVFQYSMAGGQGVTVLVQVKDATTYAIIGTGSEDVVNRAEPPADVMNTISGFTFIGEEVDLPTTVEEFEAYVNSFVGDVPPGMSIAIALGDDVIYTKGFGVADGPQEKEATPDTVYQWGSMVKMVTASAIMQLWEQGLIDLDAPVSDYLDYVPAEYPITVRQLLNHSAGLPEADLAHRLWVPDGEPLVDPDLASRAYIEEIEGPIFEPGSASAYANPHLMLVGQIVAEVSGQPYIEYVQEHILAPLGMDNTDFSYSNEDILANAATHAIPVAQVEGFITSINEVWELGDASDLIRETDDQYAWLNHYNILAAYGGLKGPPSEAIRFMQMHLNGGELDGVRILSPESVALMQEIQLSTTGEPLLFTLGWFIHDDPEHPYIEHAGGGVGIRDLMRLYPDDGIAIVLMSNAGGYDELPVMDAAANVVFSMMGGAPADEGEAQSESLAEQQDLTPELLADFEAYVEQNRESLNVPGAVVAIVQGGEIVYAEGFGVKELGGDDPVTADTVFSIGSTTKALTSMMAASLVDDGLIEWDTPLVEVMPQFQLSDEGATQQITLREAFAHTSGLPNTDLVLFFSGQPEDYVEYLAGVPLAAAPGEAYGYQNQMYALGGYAAAMAAGAEYGENLFPTYAGLMQERVFDPLGMTSATFSAQEAAAGPNHATPHFMSLNGTLAETGFDVTPTKYWDVDAIAPSGTARMSAPDLGRFLITMLSGGVAPDGSRAISAENLAETWTEQIALEPNPYLEQRGSALGWSTVTYQGIPLVSKDGSSSGFFTQMAFIPEADTGIVVLTNADVLGGSLVRNVQYRFIEMLFGLEPLIDEVAATELEGIGGASDLFNQLVAVDPETVAPFLGSYDMEGSPYTVELRDGRLWVSFGEVDFIELLAAPDGSYMAISGGSDFLLAPFQFVEGDDGRITMVMFGQLELPKLD